MIARNISNTKKIEELSQLLHKTFVFKPTQNPLYKTSGVKENQFSTSYRYHSDEDARVEKAREWIEMGSVSEKIIIVPSADPNIAMEMLSLAQLLTGYSDMDPIFILRRDRATEARMSILSELGAEILYDATGRASGTWATLMSLSKDGRELHVNAAQPYEYSRSELLSMIDFHAYRRVDDVLHFSLPSKWDNGYDSEKTYGSASTALSALSFGSADTSAYDEALDILEKEKTTKQHLYVKLVFTEQNVNQVAELEKRINCATEQLAGLCTIYNRLLRRYGIKVPWADDDFIRSVKEFELLGGREYARAFIEDGINVDDLVPESSL